MPFTLLKYEDGKQLRVDGPGLTSHMPSHNESSGLSDCVVSDRFVVRVDSARIYC
jgi:hypothetical protein